MNVKHNILLRKAKKFFESHPKKTSTILKMTSGNIDTHWNVQRANGKLNITEINSNKKSFVISEVEKTNAGAIGAERDQYNPDQSSSGLPKQGTPDSQRLAQRSIRASPAAAKYADIPDEKPTTNRPSKAISGKKFDQERQRAQKAIKRNKPLQNKTTKSTVQPSSPGFQAANTKMASVLSAAGQTDPHNFEVIKKAAKHLSDQEFKDFYGGPKHSYTQRPTARPGAMNLPQGITPYPQPGDRVKDAEKDLAANGREKTLANSIQRKYRVTLREADGDIKGFDQAGSQPDPVTPAEQPPNEPQKTSEEQAVNKLAGQTIKNAEFESDENGHKLSLVLAGTSQPATLEWNQTGKILFTFKGARYVLKK